MVIVPRAEVEAWLADEVDPAAAAELAVLLARSADDPIAAAELADRFAGPLTFGTAGLRGRLRAGPNGMNRTVVRRAAAGLARWLDAEGHAGSVVVVGCDARHGSVDFARDSAAVLAAAGFDARLLPPHLPTPVLAYAVRALGAQAGVMVTASHNPPADNGYKVYVADGAQIASPTDLAIEASIRGVGTVSGVALSDGYTSLDGEIVEQYVRDVAALATGGGPRELRIVHTSLHGVGAGVARRVFAAAGFTAPEEVPEQAEPDPDFPTVAFPNPEEPGALDLAVALAERVEADLVIANDPDADRCAVAVPGSGEGVSRWRMLRGDEVGVLLADALLGKGIRGTYATTIVSSTMLRSIAAAHRVGYAETLTGFKWISRAAPDLVYGYEEALGYAVAPHLVRDKDGISAALLVAELAAGLKARGSSLSQRLDELAGEYGRHATDQVSIRVDDLPVIGATMARLRAEPPVRLLGEAVTAEDLLPAADVLTMRFPGGRVVIRPSGTEPKLKAYLEVVLAGAGAGTGPTGDAETLLGRLRAEVTSLLAPASL